MSQVDGARVFREAWIEGVHRHFPGEPKPGYVTPGRTRPSGSARPQAPCSEQVRQFIEISGGHTANLSREQKGRFVAVCWTAQMFKHFEDPKPGYVADWPDLPAWQQETDADIFEVIEKS